MSSRFPNERAGWTGITILLGVFLFAFAVTLLFLSVRPPTVDEVERDIWVDWARLATDAQGLTLVDQLLDGRRAAAQQLLETLGRIIETEGDRFVVRTSISHARIRDLSGVEFAAWKSPLADTGGWKELSIDLVDPTMGKVGTLEVGYRFYGGGLDSLPNIRRLRQQYTAALWLVAVFAVAVVVAVLINVLRIRERAQRLQHQEVTLQLAHQMCHELRNGLWAFSLEGRNLTQLIDLLNRYLQVREQAVRDAGSKLGLTASQVERFERVLNRYLAEAGVDPIVDLAAGARMAQEALQQVESFSRYLNLTVEELDRNLLGAGGQWEPVLLRLSDAWRESCLLLQLRFRSAGVEIESRIADEDDHVVADRRSLVHVFINLAKNAIEAMRDGPGPRVLSFVLRADAERVIAEIRNRGTPIPPEILSRVFDRGFSTKPGAGRGTGLALARDSIRRMGGTIEIKSEPEDETCVQVSLPRVPAPSGRRPGES